MALLMTTVLASLRWGMIYLLVMFQRVCTSPTDHPYTYHPSAILLFRRSDNDCEVLQKKRLCIVELGDDLSAGDVPKGVQCTLCTSLTDYPIIYSTS